MSDFKTPLQTWFLLNTTFTTFLRRSWHHNPSLTIIRCTDISMHRRNWLCNLYRRRNSKTFFSRIIIIKFSSLHFYEIIIFYFHIVPFLLSNNHKQTDIHTSLHVFYINIIFTFMTVKLLFSLMRKL